jgi:ketosteroid isomerase-like protein
VTAAHHRIVREFLSALSRGELSDDMLTPDFSGWTVMSGPVDRATYQGAFKVFSSIFAEGPVPTIHSLTAEEDRVVAEFRSKGILRNGEPYQNDYLFLFRIRDGRIAYVGEYFNPDVVRAKIAPAMAAAMAAAK